MVDKICYNPNLIPFIFQLDYQIVNEFILPCAYDLRKLSEFMNTLKLTKEQINMLNEINFIWIVKKQYSWDYYYNFTK